MWILMVACWTWLTICSQPGATLPTRGDLPVQISAVQVGKGPVHLALFATAAHFAARQNACHEAVLPVRNTNQIVYVIPNLPHGNYALAVYQDLNNNGKLDTNHLGIPQEPYAFSGNPRAKWKAPGFAETVFLFSDRSAGLALELKFWSER